MPLKLTAGVSKKVGLPNYSSVGATCHAELELDHDLIFAAPHVFRAHVHEVYERCAEAVEEELARQGALRSAAETCPPRAAGHGPVSGNGHAHDNGDGNGNGHAGSPSASPGRIPGRAGCLLSARQRQYAQTLACRLGMDGEDLHDLCRRLFARSLDELTSGEASRLIGTLQAMRDEGPPADPACDSQGE
jgi:hypothetical protein